MTLSRILLLFSTLVVLAAIPSVSVLVVVTRSATFGFGHGALTTLGIVTGDVIFIAVALWGLAWLSATLGSLFVLVKYGAGIYLIVLGLGLCRFTSMALDPADGPKTSRVSSFLMGLAITLGDQKAILFYLGFFPAFVDLATISYREAGLVIATTVVAVGGVKLGYGLMADRARAWLRPQVRLALNRLAGAVMVAVGLVLMVKA
ncbi:MAG: LysE family translocator [Nodosilinea sp.]